MNRKIAFIVGGVGLALVLGWWRLGGGEEAEAPVEEAKSQEASKTQAKKQQRSPRDRRAPSFDVLLDDDPEGALRLEGLVEGPDKQPVSGAVVTIDANPRRTARSGEDGTFFFDKLVGRPYRVVARTDARFAGPVTVSLTETNDPVILTLRDAARVEVSVRASADGKAVAGATVEIRSIALLSAQTNESGVAAVRGVAPGFYRIMTVAEGFAPTHSVLRVPSGTETVEHEVALSKGAPVSGVVQTDDGKPVAGARVTYAGVSSWTQNADVRLDSILTDAAGKFRFDALPGGSFRFVARADGHAPGTSEIVTLNGRTEPSLVTVLVPAGAIVSGVVVDADGKPASSARVRVQVKSQGMRWRSRARQVYTSDKGEFEMKNLPAKEVEVAALHERGSSDTLEVELQAKAPAEVTLELTNTGIIAGTVVDSVGEPIEGAQVSAWPSFGQGGRGRRRRQLTGRIRELTDAGGRFVLRGLGEGEYSLRANPPGSPMRARMWFRDSVEAQVGDEGVKLVLPADGSVKGKVTFENGEAPEAFTVGFGFGAPTPFSTRDGSFTLSDLPPRGYSLVVRGVGFDDRRLGEVVVKEGEATDVGTITVKRGRRLAGRVIDGTGAPVEGALVRAGKNIFGDGSSSKAAFGPPWARNAKETRSGDDGAFVISGLGPGRLSVVSEHEEKGRSPVIALSPQDDGTQLTLALQPFGALEGTVTKGGKPVSEVMVQAAMVASPQVTYGVQTGEDGTFRFDRLAPGLYKVSAISGRPMRGMNYFRKEINVNSDQVAKVDLAIDMGDVTLTVELAPKNAEATGLSWVRAVRGNISARTALELELAVAAADSDVAPRVLSIRGQPAEVQGLSAGQHTVCAVVFPTEVRGMGTTMAYIEREGDNLPCFCKSVNLGDAAAQSLQLQVEVPDYVPDSDT